MKIEILLGKAKTGKSKYIYDQIDQDIKAGKEDILFVPSQSRLLTEEDFMRSLNKVGILGINITTITSYIAESLKSSNLHFDEKHISKLSKKILLAKIVADNDNIFKTFSKVKKKQGFLDMLYMYMDIFRKENIQIEELENMYFSDPILKSKLEEIVKIFKVYSDALNERFVDSVEEIDYFIQELLANRVDVKDKNIFFDGYNNFTSLELKLIESFILNGANVTISLNTDISDVKDIYSLNTQSIFEVTNKTYLKILKTCNDNGIEVQNNLFYNNYSGAKEDIAYLTDNLFDMNNKSNKLEKSNNIKLTIENNIYSEIENIACKIAKMIREGYRYKDFCIYTTDIQSYSNVMSRIFYEYDIPFYVDKKQSIENSKLVTYILGLFDIGISGINEETIMNILGLGLNDIPASDIYELDNYIKEFNINKYAIIKEFKINNTKSNEFIYDLDKLNGIREKILDVFNDFTALSKKKFDSKEIVGNIYNHLNDNKIFLNYDNYIIDSESTDITYTSLLNHFETQVWDKVSEILDAICTIYEDQEISIEEFYQVFKMTLKESSIKTIPPTIDTVQLVDINVSKIEVKKIGFFVGVNENSFPQKVDQDLLFSDFEIEKLENKDLAFKESSLSKLNMQMYNIYEALSNIYEELHISILSSDSLGKALRPSSLITLIKQTIELEIIGNIANIEDQHTFEDIYSKEKMFEFLASELVGEKEEKDTNKIQSIYEYFKEIESYDKILSYKKDDSNLDKESIEKLYGEQLNTSVSRLELFNRCPFSYFMQYSLNIKPRNEYEISTLDTGNFMHEVLDKFSNYLLKNNITWHEILKDEDNIHDKYKEVLFEIINKELNIIFKKHKDNIRFSILKQKLVGTMQNVLAIIAKGFNQSEFEPYGYEIEFKDSSAFLPIEIKIDENRSLKLIGKIDRVDVLKEEDKSYVRVVDYKSSARSLDIDDIKEGISLQLITYLTAFLENMNKNEEHKYIPAACVYFNLSDKLVNLSDYTNDETKIKSEVIKALRMKGLFLKDIKILEKMDKKLSNTNERLLDISKVSLNRDSKKALDREQFEELCKEAKQIIKKIGKNVLEGVVKIAPNKKADHCKYCNYSSICRKNSCL